LGSVGTMTNWCVITFHQCLSSVVKHMITNAEIWRQHDVTSGKEYLIFYRDVHETFWAETRLETHVSEVERRPRLLKFCPRPRRGVAASETLAETLRLLRLSRVSGRDSRESRDETLESLGSFNISPRRFPWHMVKHFDNEKNYMD